MKCGGLTLSYCPAALPEKRAVKREKSDQRSIVNTTSATGTGGTGSISSPVELKTIKIVITVIRA